jgi:hypothetical protein
MLLRELLLLREALPWEIDWNRFCGEAKPRTVI